MPDGTKLVVMGDSPLAIDVASKLDATLLPSIVNESALEDLRSVVDGTEDHIKVAFMDYGDDDSFHTQTPEEIKERLEIAGDIVGENCTSKSHTKKCELIHFVPLSSPSQHVLDNEPADIDPSNDHTSWFTNMEEMLTGVSFESSGSYAFFTNNHARTKHNKQQHFWRNWVQFDNSDPSTKADFKT